MIPDKMLQVLKCEGVVAVVTMGDNIPHVVNTWNSYLSITQDDQLLIPVGGDRNGRFGAITSGKRPFVVGRTPAAIRLSSSHSGGVRAIPKAVL